MKQLPGTPFRGRLQFFIRQDWKRLTGTNRLAYYQNSNITREKSFMTLCRVVIVTKLFSLTLTNDLVQIS
jgi:hypothetical protein